MKCCDDDDCDDYDNGYDDGRDEGYDEGYEDGLIEGKDRAIHTSERPPTCPICGELLQKELLLDNDVVKCEKCRSEFKLVEVK